MSDPPANPIDAIRGEIFRLRADASSVGPIDAIYAHDRGHGNVVLQGSSRASSFDWFGEAEETRNRLSALPDDAGPEAIRSEFHDGAG